jgi:hypothetical protein
MNIMLKDDFTTVGEALVDIINHLFVEFWPKNLLLVHEKAMDLYL